MTWKIDYHDRRTIEQKPVAVQAHFDRILLELSSIQKVSDDYQVLLELLGW